MIRPIAMRPNSAKHTAKIAKRMVIPAGSGHRSHSPRFDLAQPSLQIEHSGDEGKWPWRHDSLRGGSSTLCSTQPSQAAKVLPYNGTHSYAVICNLLPRQYPCFMGSVRRV